MKESAFPQTGQSAGLSYDDLVYLIYAHEEIGDFTSRVIIFLYLGHDYR